MFLAFLSSNFTYEVEWHNEFVSQIHREAFRGSLRTRDGWNGNHVQGDGSKRPNRHWFDESSSPGEV